jgi:DNA-binding NtrC family response regulator
MANRIRVLLADTLDPDADPLACTLRGRGMDVVAVRDRSVLAGMVASDRFDVVVLDLRLTDASTVSTLRAIRSVDVYTPVLLLTLGSDLCRMGEVLWPGGADFLLSPCPTETLVAAIEDASERESWPPMPMSGAG